MTCVVTETEVLIGFETRLVHIYGPFDDAEIAQLFAETLTRSEGGHDFVGEVHSLEKPS